ncbi:MAG TPA: type II toxin-antitoxin system RelE/ParE family toxin, partial [Planctomycetota bacterium]|nr:type II toxin-antitoxin system RelE/ParE family toxin [Planctomycetota bacterium]
MKEARLSVQARADLEEIWLFIAEDSPDAADRFIDRILGTCQRLAHSPRIGRSREDLASGIRSFRVDKYIIFYRAAKSGIEVARVLSGYRD